MKKWVVLLACLALMTIMAEAQMLNPVRFTSALKELKGGEGELTFTGTIDVGWHVYSTNLGNDGPIQATFNAVKMEGVETVGSLQARGNEIKKYDQLFGMELRYFEHNVTFVQRIKFTKPEYTIDCYLEYGACDDKSCLPPSTVELKKSGNAPQPPKQEDEKKTAVSSTVDSNDAVNTNVISVDSTEAVSAGFIDTLQTSDTVPSALVALEASDIWHPVINELKAFDGGQSSESASALSLWMIFLEGLLGGLLALFTPCVWPVIPMTVSFFLKRNKDRRKAISEAVAYGVSIVVIYVLLGLAVTLLFGASALNALATNAVFNVFFCLLLVFFAASFFGAFELTLPASWSGRVDAKSESTTGLLSIFLMAFTLALVSFSCTGPIIGFLLVAVSTQGSIVAPTIGMLGFAVALAVPFTLFAMFPSLLKSAPKSGGWMNVVKVVLAFIELAFALKFFSVADLAYGWHLLDREVFLSLWIVIFALLGIYLLGWLKFPHDDDNRRTSVPRFFLALASLAFAVYMVPGLWGAPLKAISAFAPPMNTQDFNLQPTTTEPRFTDFEQGMAAAKAEGKPVMIDFTGFGCVNCRKMEAAVWTDARVADLLNNHYVLISLYVDDKTPLSTPMVVSENEQTRTLRTVGDKWSYLQRVKFGANAQPFYVLIDTDGKPLAGSRSYDEDVSQYVEFLQTGLSNYHKNQ